MEIVLFTYPKTVFTIILTYLMFDNKIYKLKSKTYVDFNGSIYFM